MPSSRSAVMATSSACSCTAAATGGSDSSAGEVAVVAFGGVHVGVGAASSCITPPPAAPSTAVPAGPAGGFVPAGGSAAGENTCCGARAAGGIYAGWLRGRCCGVGASSNTPETFGLRLFVDFGAVKPDAGVSPFRSITRSAPFLRFTSAVAALTCGRRGGELSVVVAGAGLILSLWSRPPHKSTVFQDFVTAAGGRAHQIVVVVHTIAVLCHLDVGSAVELRREF